MATSLSRTHRLAQRAIARATERDLRRLFPALDLNRLRETWPAFERAVLLLIRERGRLSAGIASRYYREARAAANAPGVPPPMRATPTADEIVAGLRAMGPGNAAQQLSLGRPLEEVRRATLVNITGVATKFALDHGRDVVLNAVRDDRHAKGWARETSGAPCDFCSMLAGRGAVYGSEATAGFESHRHCSCQPAPVW